MYVLSQYCKTKLLLNRYVLYVWLKKHEVAFWRLEERSSHLTSWLWSPRQVATPSSSKDVARRVRPSNTLVQLLVYLTLTRNHSYARRDVNSKGQEAAGVAVGTRSKLFWRGEKSVCKWDLWEIKIEIYIRYQLFLLLFKIIACQHCKKEWFMQSSFLDFVVVII